MLAVKSIGNSAIKILVRLIEHDIPIIQAWKYQAPPTPALRDFARLLLEPRREFLRMLMAGGSVP